MTTSVGLFLLIEKMNSLVFFCGEFLQAYKPLKTFIALVALEVWSNNDLISVTNPAGANLDAFMKWRNSDLVKRTKHDNAHLIRSVYATHSVSSRLELSSIICFCTCIVQHRTCVHMIYKTTVSQTRISL